MENCLNNLFLNKYRVVPIAFLYKQIDVFQHYAKFVRLQLP